MKAPKYILRNVYTERNNEREYQSHVERMKGVRSSMSLTQSHKEIANQEKRVISQHSKANKFKQDLKDREEKLANKALIGKLLEIQDGKYSVVKNSTNGLKPNKTVRSEKIRPHSSVVDIENQSVNQENLENKDNGEEKQQVEQKQQTQNEAFSQNNSKTLRARGHSDYGSTHRQKSLNHLVKKKEIERISQENQILAARMIKLPPVYQKNKHDQEFKEHKKLKERVRKFHYLENKKPYQVKKEKFEEVEDEDGLDETNEELMTQKIHVVIRLIDISFINFLPVNWEEEKYFLEIKAANKAVRRTTTEMYMDFSKSVINEFFLLKELKKSKIMYIALYQRKDQNDRFLGDFELDLTPYFQETMTREIHHDLRNWKELHNLPNYMPKDMRRKGWIDFELVIKSNVKQYLDNLQKVDEREEEDDDEQDNRRK